MLTCDVASIGVRACQWRERTRSRGKFYHAGLKKCMIEADCRAIADKHYYRPTSCGAELPMFSSLTRRRWLFYRGCDDIAPAFRAVVPILAARPAIISSADALYHQINR